jgi:hypothetical protein
MSKRNFLVLTVCATFTLLMTLGINREVGIESPAPFESPLTIEALLRFEAPFRFEYTPSPIPCNRPIIAIDTILNTADSWGKGRSFTDYVVMLKSFTYPSECIHLNLLISDEKEYKMIKEIVNSTPLPFAKIVLMLDEGSKGDSSAHRHADDRQRERRRKIAKVRNNLLYSTLSPIAQGVLWIDADVVVIPKHLLSDVVDSGRDIVASQTNVLNSTGEYDLNTWMGNRAKPSPEEFIEIRADRLNYVPHGISETHFLSSLSDTEGDRFHEVQSVGGTFLFVKADIHRQGINFPPYYVVGTQDWEMIEGYDGIETEGMCYIARAMGYTCWGMPHLVDRVYHRRN